MFQSKNPMQYARRGVRAPIYTTTPRNSKRAIHLASSIGWAEFWPKPMKFLVDMSNHAHWLKIVILTCVRSQHNICRYISCSKGLSRWINFVSGLIVLYLPANHYSQILYHICTLRWPTFGTKILKNSQIEIEIGAKLELLEQKNAYNLPTILNSWWKIKVLKIKGSEGLNHASTGVLRVRH